MRETFPPVDHGDSTPSTPLDSDASTLWTPQMTAELLKKLDKSANSESCCFVDAWLMKTVTA